MITAMLDVALQLAAVALFVALPLWVWLRLDQRRRDRQHRGVRSHPTYR